MQTTRRIIESILPLAFIAMLFIPLMDNFFGLNLDKTVSTEKRELAAMPEWELDSIEVLPGKHEAYFNDHFPFRNMLIRGFSLLSTEVFDVSSVADILKGEDNWLFYVGSSKDNSISDHVGLICLKEPDLRRITSGIDYRKRVLDSMKIPFVILIAPDKSSIYPEFLPGNIKRKGPCSKRLDQIIDYLETHSTARVLDVRSRLRAEKKNSKFLIYSKTDSHWNDYGGFLAYQELMRSLSVKPFDESDFSWTEASLPGGDLVGELSLVGRLMEERGVQVVPRVETGQTSTNVANDYGVADLLEYRKVIRMDSAALPKLLFIHDSFGGSLLKFLPKHYREVVCLETPQFSPRFVESEKPDVVIIEIVERNAEMLAVKTFH